jgi:hypothetical protein
MQPRRPFRQRALVARTIILVGVTKGQRSGAAAIRNCHMKQLRSLEK